MPPPANSLALVLVTLIVPVPVTVKFVDVSVFQAPAPAPVPASVQVPEPMAIVRVFEFELETPDVAPDKVKLFVAASKVPAVIPNAAALFELMVNGSCNVTDPPGVFMANVWVKVLPALVIV